MAEVVVSAPRWIALDDPFTHSFGQPKIVRVKNNHHSSHRLSNTCHLIPRFPNLARNPNPRKQPELGYAGGGQTWIASF